MNLVVLALSENPRDREEDAVAAFLKFWVMGQFEIQRLALDARNSQKEAMRRFVFWKNDYRGVDFKGHRLTPNMGEADPYGLHGPWERVLHRPLRLPLFPVACDLQSLDFN